MINKSPSGALSPYYYKGGYFHGIHYGSYFDRENELLEMMGKEEAYILSSPERRRVLIDFYETDLSPALIGKIAAHLERLSPKIVKLAVTSDRRSLRRLRKAVVDRIPLGAGQLCFSTDMEEAKTWLVTER